MRRLSVSRGLGILIVLALLAAIACGGASTATSPAPTAAASAPTAAPGETPVAVPTTAPTATPPPAADAQPVVQRLRVAVAIERESNDPHQVPLSASAQNLPMYEALVRFNKLAEFVPMLATGWEVSSDLKDWTFDLRKGVQWHRGFGEVTTADVVHSIERHTREESISADAKFWRESVIDNIEVVDDYQIVYHLPQPKLDIPEISITHRHTWILNKAHFDVEGQEGIESNPVGTGPYQFVERVGGAYVLYERVPYQHWRKTPDFPELQIFFVKEQSTRLAMLLAGEADIVTLPSDLESTAVSNGMEVIPARVGTAPLYLMFGGNFYPDKPVGTRKGEHPNLPFSDVLHPVTEVPWVDRRVREALNRAVNREQLQATILGGKGEPMPVPFYHASMRGWNPEWLERYEENYGYDLERARELLAEVEAEIGEPLDWSKLVFLITPRPEVTELADVGEAISNYWRDIGVDLKLEVQEFATFREHIIRGSVGGVAWADGTIRFEDPRMLEVVYYSGRDPAVGGICCHFFERDTIDSVFEKLVPATDFDVRDQLLREAGNFIYEEYALLPLFWMTASFTVNPEVVADYPTTGFRGAQDLEDVVAVKK